MAKAHGTRKIGLLASSARMAPNEVGTQGSQVGQFVWAGARNSSSAQTKFSAWSPEPRSVRKPGRPSCRSCSAREQSARINLISLSV